MQTRRRSSRLALALAAVGTAAALLVGCSSSDSGTESLPEAKELLQQSSQTTKKLQSAHLEIAVNGKIEGLPVKKLSGDLTNVPAVAVKGDATITMGGSDLDAGLVVTDGILYAELSPDNWLDLGPAVDIYDPSSILNPQTGLSNMLTSFSDPKSEATESINGIDTVKITGDVSADAVNKLVPQLKATNAVPGTAWIQKDGDHNLVRAEVQPSSDQSIQMTLSQWNEPVTVTKPPV
ncbi:LppX_LprAFG lipoprotein [Mycolicibacterium palauense]|uniref:LppX_LprAFG lipoprotein n=1 Tax=Mycolicibacterium palauense TaxID=2034511 RepID=UPI000BFEF06C|nr:LppX_LprAFG lipoprotein [Mycolicibacterium palauense]